MGLVGSIGKAAGAVAKFCDDYNVVDVMHYALIPGIIIIGMYTTPRPTLAQLLTPF